MWKTLRQIGRTGIITEPPPASDDTLRVAGALQSRILEVLGRALCIRAIDAGSCNGCELEIHALNNPLYNIEGLMQRADRKSTRLNSSHANISYAVFCLEKKKQHRNARATSP